MKSIVSKVFVIIVMIVVVVGIACNTSRNSDVRADNLIGDSFEESSDADKDNIVIIKENTGTEKRYNLLNSEAIIGKDNRRKISDPTKFPYSAIARLDYTYPCGCEKFATGFLISDNTMLTSRSCEYCDKHYMRFNSLTCKFGYSYSSGKEEYVLCSNDWISTYTVDSDAAENNYMYVEFRIDIGSLIGHFGIKAFDNKALNGKTFNVGGYSVDYKQPLKVASGKVTAYSGSNDWILTYKTDTVQGNGGGPLYDGKNYVAGIHIGGSKEGKLNYSIRITQGIMDDLYEHGLIDNSKIVTPDNPEKMYPDDGDWYMFEKGSHSVMTIPLASYELTDVYWSSSDETVASVNELGVIYAHKIGYAAITAEYENVTITVNVFVVYDDVKDTDKYWFTPTYVLSVMDVVKGYDNQTKFKPANKCTRAQMITFLWRLEGCPNPQTKKCVFSDVKKGDYFYKAVIWGNEKGIVEGYKDGTFGPQKVCKRKHAVTFLWRLAGEPEPGTKKNKFKDITEKDYFYQAVLWASKNKIVAGYSDGTFKPNGDCLRRQMVTFLYKYGTTQQQSE